MNNTAEITASKLTDEQLREWARGLARDSYPCVSDEEFTLLDENGEKVYLWMGREHSPLPTVVRAAMQSEYDRINANRTPVKPTLDDLAIQLAEWQDATFPHKTSASIAEHLRREANELVANPTDPEEMADCAMLVFGAAAHAGVDLAAAIAAKLAKNRARTWGTPDAHGVVEHVELPTDAELIEFGRGLARAYVRNREVNPPIPRGAYFEKDEVEPSSAFITYTRVSRGGDSYATSDDWIGLTPEQRTILLEEWAKRDDYNARTGGR